MKNSLDVLLFMAFVVSTHAQGNKSINRAPGRDLDLGATGYGEQELYGADHSIRLLIPFWQA